MRIISIFKNRSRMRNEGIFMKTLQV